MWVWHRYRFDKLLESKRREIKLRIVRVDGHSRRITPCLSGGLTSVLFTVQMNQRFASFAKQVETVLAHSQEVLGACTASVEASYVWVARASACLQ